MIEKADNNLRIVETTVASKSRAKQKEQTPLVIWLTGLSGAGKSTLACALEQELYKQQLHTFILDGDNLRSGINSDLDFSTAGRQENIRRVGEIAKLFCDAGIITIVSLISPFQLDRDRARQIVQPHKFIAVYVKASLESCIKRDPKGFYARALRGEIPNFTGLDSIYEEPACPDLTVQTEHRSVEESAQQLITYLSNEGFISATPVSQRLAKAADG